MKAKHNLPTTWVIILTAVCAWLPVHTGFTQDYQDPASIKNAARAYVQDRSTAAPDQIKITTGRIDPRLRLPRCNQPLEAFKAPGTRMQGNTSIGVRCNGTSPWKLYVPVKISIYKNVLIAKNYLKRGTPIKASDIELQQRDISTLTRGYVTEPQRIIGLILKSPLMADAVLTPSMLEARKLVHRGEGVIILAKNNGIEVRMKGKALADGTDGQLIQVKNLSSQRIVEGQVISRGIVSVPL